MASWAGIGFAGVKKVGEMSVGEINKQATINRALNPSTPHGQPFKVPKGVKVIGKFGGYGFTLWSMNDVNSQWQSGALSTRQMVIEQISNGIGVIPAYGTGWSFGWELGKSYGPSKWYGNDDTKWFR